MKPYRLKKCLACGNPLAGRSDKKFCGDQCRASYNNQSSKPHEQQIKLTNQSIRRNRTILKSLCPTGKATVRKEVLEEMGFDFTSFSSLYPTKSGVYYLSYDYGFMPVAERERQKVLIIQKQKYMDEKPFNPWSYLK